MTAIRFRTAWFLAIAAAVLALQVAAPVVAWAGQSKHDEGQTLDEQTPLHELNPIHDIQVALIRLPLAAALGAALALRPRRRGTPPRTPAVLQTQIILSIVGAVIMLVVGASLARAFGIVGAANLIRYRSKIDDPKDAVVMLCTLAVGLASGVGLYALAVVSTAFIAGGALGDRVVRAALAPFRAQDQSRGRHRCLAAEDRRHPAAISAAVRAAHLVR